MNATDRDGTESLSEEQLLDLARSSLDGSIDGLDAATLSRLTQAREAALSSGQQAHSGRFWLSTGAAAFAVLALAIALPQQLRDAPQITQPPALEETWAASADDVQLVEDLDLLLWMMDDG